MALADAYDAFLLDLDGVVYRGEDPVPGAAEVVAELRDRGRRPVFLTNNSARTPEAVAALLQGMAVPAEPDDVVTSAQAAATVVAGLDGPRTAFVIGEAGIRRALEDAGIEVLDGDPREAGFVIVGWDRSVDYDKLKRASVLVRAGARLVATNGDPSFPAPGDELWPGAGALLAAVETATGGRAVVAGKPHGPLFEEAVRRAGGGRSLVVGDRLDTDVAGAAAAGLPAMLVLSGAARVADLLDRDALPVAVAPDLRGLVDDRPVAGVRPAAGPDARAVAGLLSEGGLDPTGIGSHIHEIVVVEAGGTVLACAGAEVRGRDAYLHSVAAREDARGRHLGSLAAAGASGRARDAGARRLWLLTETAEGFFERLGFVRVARAEVPAWVEDRAAACTDAAAAMVRNVAGASGDLARTGPS